MNRCPGCGYIVPGGWAECRRCGAAIKVAGPVAVPVAATVSAPAYEPYVEPVIIRTAPIRPQQPRVNGRTIAFCAVTVVIVVAGVSSLIPHGGHHTATAATILAPEAPSAGIPTSLSAIVRIAAESSRHTALSTVIGTAGPEGSPVTVTQLASIQPNYQWVLGDQPSTTNTIISVTSASGSDVIAVSATSREVCAFGRWSPATGASYVTMAHAPTCSANAAPASGWTTQPGGSAQDLPGLDGS